MAKRSTVLLLRVAFSIEIKNSPHTAKQIGLGIGRPFKACMHSPRALAFVIATKETAAELMDRLRPTLEASSLVEDYWCHTAAKDVVGRYGSFCTLAIKTAEMWEEARKFNEAQDVKDAERRKLALKHRREAVFGTPKQKGLAPHGARKPAGHAQGWKGQTLIEADSSIDKLAARSRWEKRKRPSDLRDY